MFNRVKVFMILQVKHWNHAILNCLVEFLLYLTHDYDVIYWILMCTGPNYKSCLLPTRWQGCCGILCYECGCSTKVALQGYSTTEICKALYPFTFMVYIRILNTGLSSIASSYNWQTWNFSTSTPIWKKRNYVVIFFINLVKLILLTFRPYRILATEYLVHITSRPIWLLLDMSYIYMWIDMVFEPQIGGSGVLVTKLTYIFDEETPRWRNLLTELGL